MSERAEVERAVAENLGWEMLTESERQDGLTCKGPDGSMIAMRFDWPSVETGNHYLEVESREIERAHGNHLDLDWLRRKHSTGQWSMVKTCTWPM